MATSFKDYHNTKYPTSKSLNEPKKRYNESISNDYPVTISTKIMVPARSISEEDLDSVENRWGDIPHYWDKRDENSDTKGEAVTFDILEWAYGDPEMETNMADDWGRREGRYRVFEFTSETSVYVEVNNDYDDIDLDRDLGSVDELDDAYDGALSTLMKDLKKKYGIEAKYDYTIEC